MKRQYICKLIQNLLKREWLLMSTDDSEWYMLEIDEKAERKTSSTHYDSLAMHIKLELIIYKLYTTQESVDCITDPLEQIIKQPCQTFSIYSKQQLFQIMSTIAEKYKQIK